MAYHTCGSFSFVRQTISDRTSTSHRDRVEGQASNRQESAVLRCDRHVHTQEHDTHGKFQLFLSQDRLPDLIQHRSNTFEKRAFGSERKDFEKSFSSRSFLTSILVDRHHHHQHFSTPHPYLISTSQSHLFHSSLPPYSTQPPDHHTQPHLHPSCWAPSARPYLRSAVYYGRTHGASHPHARTVFECASVQ